MDRWACVDVPALPLQILLAGNPAWAEFPVAVVAREAPQGEIVLVNRKARRAGVHPGLRYAAALGLAADLRAGTVSPSEIDGCVAALAARMVRFTPDVEPSRETPGVFWLDAGGLTSLFRSEEAWAHGVAADLAGCGYHAAVAVGFTRFGAYAVARTRGGAAVFASPEEEQAAARRVPVARLDLPPDVVGMLDLLGIDTVADFLRLPAAGVRQRFGEEAYTLHRRASGELWTPLQPYRDEPPSEERIDLDHAETNAARLLALVERLLAPLVRSLERRGDALAELVWTFSFEWGAPERYGVRPAAPTLDVRQIIELVRLRLESVELPRGVTGIALVARSVPARAGQLALFAAVSRRDLAAADRALARIRAEFGEASIVRATLQDAHLPEARFRWEPLLATRLPRPSPSASRPLVRRLYTRPMPLSPTVRGTFARAAGPHIVSGGWWMREVHREYHFVRSRNGRLLWVYYDRPRARWFIHGEVE